MTNPHQIRIFLDGADRATMVEMASNPLVQGFTTNPTLMKKAGVKDYVAFCREILTQIRGKPISFEVFADEPAEMKRQAKIITGWDIGGDNVYVKIPVVNTKGESMSHLIEELTHDGIKVNVTAIYTLPQIWSVCQAAKGGASTLVSVFAGRMADTGRDPIPVMQAGVEMCRSAGANLHLLWASTRESFNIVQAEQMGCAIITAPADMIRKVAGFGKDMQELTLETVRTFKADAESAGFKL